MEFSYHQGPRRAGSGREVRGDSHRRLAHSSHAALLLTPLFGRASARRLSWRRGLSPATRLQVQYVSFYPTSVFLSQSLACPIACEARLAASTCHALYYWISWCQSTLSLRVEHPQVYALLWFFSHLKIIYLSKITSTVLLSTRLPRTARLFSVPSVFILCYSNTSTRYVVTFAFS